MSVPGSLVLSAGEAPPKTTTTTTTNKKLMNFIIKAIALLQRFLCYPHKSIIMSVPTSPPRSTKPALQNGSLAHLSAPAANEHRNAFVANYFRLSPIQTLAYTILVD
jgi:hypothetical protein